jgi:hypothetical protein
MDRFNYGNDDISNDAITTEASAFGAGPFVWRLS